MKDIDGYVTKDELYRLISHIKMNPDIVVDDKTCHAIVNAISDMPQTDVQPVKRGQWIISNIYAKCSECSVAYDLDTFQRLIPMNENVPRHCSYCGAKMIRDGDTNG